MAETGSADRPTLDFYDAEAARYAAEVESLNDPAPLQRFMAELAPGGRVLDLGCGAGWASAMLAAAGFAVRAVDGSPGLVAEARARGVPAEVMLFEDFEEPAAYDGVWASFSLLHAPRAAFPRLLGAACRALRPGGVLYLGMKLGEGEARDRLGRRYAYWSEGKLRDLVADQGLAVLSTETQHARGMAGTVEPALHLIARA